MKQHEIDAWLVLYRNNIQYYITFPTVCINIVELPTKTTVTPTQRYNVLSKIQLKVHALFL